jgi:hypothetical protein
LKALYVLVSSETTPEVKQPDLADRTVHFWPHRIHEFNFAPASTSRHLTNAALPEAGFLIITSSNAQQNASPFERYDRPAHVSPCQISETKWRT